MRQLRLCIRKSLAIYLIMALLVLGSLPTDLMAALIPSDLDAAGLMVGADRLADIQKIQSVLESKVVAQRLTDLVEDHCAHRSLLSEEQLRSLVQLRV